MTTSPPDVDRELELVLHSPIGSMAVRGQVVQVITVPRAAIERRSPGFGVLFVDLTDDQRAFIALTLDALSRAERRAGTPPHSTRPARRSTPPRANTRPERPSTRPSASPRKAITEQDRAREEQRRKLAERRAQVLDDLERELHAAQKKSAWELLGLTPESDQAAAHRAYLAHSKRLHPHVYAHLDSPEINRVATELFILHKRAYGSLSLRPAPPPAAASQPPLEIAIPPAPRTPSVSMRAPEQRAPSRAPTRANGHTSSLRSPARRSGLESPASAATKPSMPNLKRRIADTEMALHAGLKHLAAARFDEAAAEFARARALCPERGDVAAWWHVCRARKAKASGRLEDALVEYRSVLAFEPEHREALEQISGGRAQRRRGGLIGKWFGTDKE